MKDPGSTAGRWRRPARAIGAVVEIAALTLIISLAGCGDDDGDDDCLPGCAFDATVYELRARFDWESRRLIASEDVTLMVASGSPVITLDSAVEVSRVHAGATELAFEADAEARTLGIDLTPLHPGDGPVTFTIEYEVGTSGSLLAAGPRDDDPVDSRVVFTDSEPDRGVYWLVAKHDPSDRALWSVELTVADGEDVIANGHRTRDEVTAAGRVVRYQLDTPIPTYLMAFAAGELEHADRPGGSVPLSVWYRRGLLIDPDDNLDAVAEAMAVFEDRLGPYPWESYAVVLVPQFGGGMENATITFNTELSGQGNVSFGLNAHELGHQWFGDWVTMHGYDDVWVKEGMATLLAAEAQRARRDLEDTGRRFGYDFAFDASDAIVDRDLTGLDKYTSGPYERAAWTITQIRARVGESAFWASLRQVLTDHAAGTIDGEGFVRSFAPALDEATIVQILGALEQTDVPSISIVTTPGDTITSVELTLTDPAATLIDPIALTVIDGSGAASSAELAVGDPLTVVIPFDGSLAPDEGDVHPSWDYSFAVSDSYYSELVPLFNPGQVAGLAPFLSRSPGHQERTLQEWGLPTIAPEDLAGYLADLDSVNARFSATIDGCGVLQSLTSAEDIAAWRDALAPLLEAPALPRFSIGFARCGTELATAVFGAELAALVDATEAADAGRLEYLLSFDYGAADSLAAIGAVATGSPSLRLRDLAIARLSYHTVPGYGYSEIAAGEVADWKAFFRARLPETTSVGRFRSVWRGVVALADTLALVPVAALLHVVPMSPELQQQTVCDAYAIAQDDPDAWAAFLDAAQPWDTLAPEAAALLADPTACGLSPQRRPGAPENAKRAAEARGAGDEVP